MMELLKHVYRSWETTKYDKRTYEWWPVKHEWTIYMMFGVYLYVVLRWLPRYMEKRPAYSLKSFIKYYNIMQIAYNAWIVYTAIANGALTDIGIGCAHINRSPVGRPMKVANLIYWTLMLKIIDMVETVVFVLRKKQRQVSFLHVYHHISTIFIVQLSLKFYPGGGTIIPVMVNSAVHVVMYTYYYLSSMGPKVQRIINPFKPYITIMQMVQFFFLLGHTSQTFFPHCIVPQWGAIIMFTNFMINVVLFYNFYRKNYKNPERLKKI